MLYDPTDGAITFVEYLSKANREAFPFEQFQRKSLRPVEEFERVSGVVFSHISTNFSGRNAIDRAVVVTDAELDELIGDCPALFHMAEQGSWSSIRDTGLLSTTALLDRYELEGAERDAIETQRREKSVALERTDLGRAIIRDQFPIDDSGLMRCLEDGLSTADWYRILNSKVFFWLTQDRLLRLLNAGSYRDQEHDVLEIDARRLIEVYRPRIWLCPMNSGSTKPFPHPRGTATFQRIADYPYAHWKAKRPRGERAVELAVEYAVPDVADFVTRVVRMKGSEVRANLHPT